MYKFYTLISPLPARCWSSSRDVAEVPEVISFSVKFSLSWDEVSTWIFGWTSVMDIL